MTILLLRLFTIAMVKIKGMLMGRFHLLKIIVIKILIMVVGIFQVFENLNVR